ncbi:class I SAM-dependent methyltransferase [Bacillus wiedmannii]|uniref:class I SAM-dependent methyltransferase n=1 Tax=Bacillus wiedmannii TaxID=1890302 RepID=UPI00065B53AB|nr:class I SAM-dependent methyltransferase [Bacillus wiedmannii]KMP76607.1 SAM-dependent methyltransferase [Bacillus cereus]MCQ6547198.1 methyltransferase domain-containing protein [Bacillus wiedmannii]MCQ6572442.1 methyltransferase domain-containing protein [Bacillus wiedmannii]MCU5577931.1 methyltransferase domain-containing protein [Bacillus wiedmannii]RKF52323.1 SAM-dependent methyltransferase [Bacillus wiedmannii]
MNELEYKNFYDKVGRLNGWDFSKIKYETVGDSWDFYGEVKERCKPSQILLDVGTGGGENVLNIASSAKLLIGIDSSNGMIETAHSNLKKSGLQNVEFLQMDSEALAFPYAHFDIASSCHAPFAATELSKVMKKDAFFLTQQVSEHDKLNLKEAFGRGQCLGERDGTLKEKYMRELSSAGFELVQVREYNVTDYYSTPEDLIFLLKHTPIIPNFGEEEEDFTILQKFIDANSFEKGIRTNSKRFMIIAVKL